MTGTETHPRHALNEDVARGLDEVARLLEEQGANTFRCRAYRNAAATIRNLSVPVMEILVIDGVEGLDRLPGIGPMLARSIRQLAMTGRLPMLDRLRGESDPVAVLSSVPGVGRGLAQRLHDELGIETLEQLETAAHDGTLGHLRGFGGKRVSGVRDALAARLGRLRAPPAHHTIPTVAELLDVDREYRHKARAGGLPHIAPRRFNPSRTAWLPVLHTVHGERHYTVLFSNTALAHRLAKTHDWVVLYYDGRDGEQQCTVVTASTGKLKGKRVVRGRELECQTYYGTDHGSTGTLRPA
jgi:DNA polymerase (family X)